MSQADTKQAKKFCVNTNVTPPLDGGVWVQDPSSPYDAYSGKVIRRKTSCLGNGQWAYNVALENGQEVSLPHNKLETEPVVQEAKQVTVVGTQKARTQTT
ncbi:hypothetical protein NM688_g6745 [Phlebia brevispora]|uniref:Uncharacterized protein n=1 Tax=Phlebia brevispora TaxID=194682 RepID=A0ACC1SD16_9APHY|nr:hypothetical protein NM688_g6745 [Phlebia brevispora]